MKDFSRMRISISSISTLISPLQLRFLRPKTLYDIDTRELKAGIRKPSRATAMKVSLRAQSCNSKLRIALRALSMRIVETACFGSFK